MNYFNKKLSFIAQNRYVILLISFLLLIFGNTFSPHTPVISLVFTYLNFIVGFIVFTI